MFHFDILSVRRRGLSEVLSERARRQPCLDGQMLRLGKASLTSSWRQL